jgi:hypothetical protein
LDKSRILHITDLLAKYKHFYVFRKNACSSLFIILLFAVSRIFRPWWHDIAPLLNCECPEQVSFCFSANAVCVIPYSVLITSPRGICQWNEKANVENMNRLILLKLLYAMSASSEVMVHCWKCRWWYMQKIYQHPICFATVVMVVRPDNIIFMFRVFIKGPSLYGLVKQLLICMRFEIF